MYLIHVIAGVLLLLGAAIAGSITSLDPFTVSSVPEDLTTKYPRAFYSELSNAEFEKALIQTFGSKDTCKPLALASKPDNWYTTPLDANKTVVSIFDVFVVPKLQEIMVSSPFFKGVDGVPKVIYHNVTSISKHKQMSNTYLVQSDMILHREGKFNGKHVQLAVVLSQEKGTQWQYNVVSAQVIGIVFEDQIGMYPVEAKDPFDRLQTELNTERESP